MSFSEMGLSPGLLRALAREGYTVPTPIQTQAIPAILAGRDVMGAAQTGTGKTAAFTLPMLEKLAAHKPGQRLPRALVLTPTRELASQVTEAVRTYGRDLPLRTAAIFGGVSMVPQLEALRRGVDVVIATPGRLLDHLQQRTLDLSQISFLVLDEADRMLDMGFIRDIRRVLAMLPARRQNLLFSATFSEDIRALAKTLLHDPLEIDVAPRNAPTELVNQRVVFVDKGRKRALLARLIGANNWLQVLVFTRTKHGANRLCEQLCDDGLPSTALHGNKSQGARTKALADFKGGKVRVLVATDIAARGLDIDSLPHVVNYDVPMVPEDYVHRIGRTGRAGVEGEALSLVDHGERGLLKDIQRLLKREIPQFKVEGFEPSAQPAKSADISEARGNRPQPAPRARSHHAQPRGQAPHARKNEGQHRSARPGSSQRPAARQSRGNERRQPRA